MTGTTTGATTGPRHGAAVTAAVAAAIVGAVAVGLGAGVALGPVLGPSGAATPPPVPVPGLELPLVSDEPLPAPAAPGAAPDPALVEAVVTTCTGYRDLAARLEPLLDPDVAGRPGAWDEADGAEVGEVLREVRELPVPAIRGFAHDRVLGHAKHAEEALDRWDPDGPVPVSPVVTLAIDLDVSGTNRLCREVLDGG